MGVLEDLEDILYLALVVIIAVGAIIILKTIYPGFKWLSQLLGKFGLISYIPILVLCSNSYYCIWIHYKPIKKINLKNRILHSYMLKVVWMREKFYYSKRKNSFVQ
ncbi:hypothetical protein [Candidatus Pyrohabitans sp.]